MSYLEAKGWLTANERQLLSDLAEDVPLKGHILNIGIEYGASIHCIRAGNAKTFITASDLEGREKLDKLAPLVNWMQADSGEVARFWNEPVDLVFVDGDHSYKGVTRDLEFAHHVSVDGVIAFHDCYSWEGPPKTVHKICPDVNKAVQEWYDAHGESWRELEPVDSIRYFERVA